MLVLCDNDLILKLAQCNLLCELPALLGETPNQIYVTAAARFQLLRKTESKGIDRCGNSETYQRLKDFLASTSELPVIRNTEILLSLDKVPNIDSGEQLLFAAAAELDGAILLTGDKKSLEALRSHKDSVPVVFEATKDMVVTFESALLLALAHLGFPTLKQKLLGNPKPDGVLRTILRENLTEATLVECLCSYVRDLFIFLAFKELLPGELSAQSD